MSTLFPRPLILLRPAAGSWVDGKWIPGALQTMSFVGSIQPASGRDVEALQIGRQNVGKVNVFSNTRLIVTTEGGDVAGDIVVWLGERWELLHETQCQNDLINHFKYIGEYRGPA